MDIQRSGEDYLETIYILQNRTGFVRSIDIATEMGYSKPSVSKGMSILKELGYITMAADGQIKLTKTGSIRPPSRDTRVLHKKAWRKSNHSRAGRL